MPSTARTHEVCPFTIIVDTREQAPFRFTGIKSDAAQKYRPIQIETVRRSLPTGDYSIVGMEDLISIERKSKSDFYACCGRERDRFVRELERLNKIKYAHVMIEASLEELATEPPIHSRLKGTSAVRSIFAWSIDFPNIHFHNPQGRLLAERATFRLLSFAYDRQEKMQKGLKDGHQEVGPAVRQTGLARTQAPDSRLVGSSR